MGHSLGALIALVYAARYGAHVKSLTLLNPVSTADGTSAVAARLYFRIGAWLPPRAGKWWLASRPAVWLSDVFAVRTKVRARRREIFQQDYRTYRLASTRAMVEAILSYFDSPFAEYVRAIRSAGISTLVVSGDRDRLAPAAEVAVLAVDLGPQCRHHAVPEAGHVWPTEEPAAAASLISAHLRGGASGPGGPVETSGVPAGGPGSGERTMAMAPGGR